MKRITVLGFLLAGCLVAPVAVLAGGTPGPSVLSVNRPGPSVLSAHPYGGASVLGIHQGFATPRSRQHHHVHPAFVVAPRHPVWVQPQWMWNGWQWMWSPGYWVQ
jgi:hypothetical protein